MRRIPGPAARARLFGIALVAAAAGCAPSGAAAQGSRPAAEASGASANHLLNISALAGRPVAVLPATLVVLGPTLETDGAAAPWRDRVPALRRADSLVAEALLGRGPEVRWILPAKLRKAARRAPGMIPDPDQMGQAVLRHPGLKDVPDPLRSDLRRLVSLTDARTVLVPAAVAFVADSAADSTAGATAGATAGPTVHATLALVLADARRGTILWRSTAQGAGATPDEALDAALRAVLPTDITP